MVASGILLAAGAAAGVVLTAIVVTDNRLGPVGPALYGVLILWLVLMWRLYSAGVRVSSEGVQVRQLLRTKTLLWTQVAEVASRPARLWGVNTGRQAIWVVPRDGRPIETPVQCSRGLRPGFYKNNGRVLNPAHYAHTLKLMQDRVRRR